MTDRPKLLRRVSDKGEHVGWSFWCPGCKRMHVFYVAGPLTWSFDGNMDAPTFSPSLLIYTPEWTDDNGVTHPRETQCHLVLTAGTINFCSDCAHELKGKSVPLAPSPFQVE